MKQVLFFRYAILCLKAIWKWCFKKGKSEKRWSVNFYVDYPKIKHWENERLFAADMFRYLKMVREKDFQS